MPLLGDCFGVQVTIFYPVGTLHTQKRAETWHACAPFASNALLSRDGCMDIQTTKKPVLAVIGAGPKAAALAAKAEALRSCGYADIQILVFDEGEVASHWKGNGGFTSGDCILGTPPEKDVGFPYHSQFGTDVGASVDREMLKYSWAAYFVSLGNYASWVDRGRPHPRHEVWGGYIQWGLAQTSAEVHTLTKVFKVEFGANGLIISAKGRKGTIAKPYEVDGVVFTGPGKIGDIPNNILPGSNDLVDGKSYWNLIPVFKDMHSGKVAIIGAGETAASVALSIIEINSNLAVDIINPHGALFSRGESYFENQLFSSAKAWTERSLESRQEIIRRTDQGVFSVEAMDRLAESQNVHFRGGRVVWIGRAGSGVELFFEGEKKEVPEDDKAVPPEGDE